MQPEGTTWMRLNHLLERLERVEAETLHALKDDPGLLEIRGLAELAGQLRGAVSLATIARNAADPRSQPRPDSAVTPPGSHIAAAIKRLPRAGPDVAPVIVEVNAEPTTAWHHRGRYCLTFRVRRNPRPEIGAWYWGLDHCVRLDAGA